MARRSAQNTDFYGNPIMQDEFGVYDDVNGVKDYTDKADPTMPSASGRAAYEEKLQQMQDKEAASEQVAGAQNSGTTNAAMGAGKAAASGGSATDIASAGLLASGNPYAMGAGLGLMTLSQINKRKQQEQMNQYTAEVERIKARQDAINRLSQIGANLRA